MEKIIKIADYNRSAQSWTVENMLQNLLEEPISPEYKKAVVIFLDNEKPKYNTLCAVAGLTREEIVTLLQVVQLKYVRRLAGDDES